MSTSYRTPASTGHLHRQHRRRPGHRVDLRPAAQAGDLRARREIGRHPHPRRGHRHPPGHPRRELPRQLRPDVHRHHPAARAREPGGRPARRLGGPAGGDEGRQPARERHRIRPARVGAPARAGAGLHRQRDRPRAPRSPTAATGRRSLLSATTSRRLSAATGHSRLRRRRDARRTRTVVRRTCAATRMRDTKGECGRPVRPCGEPVRLRGRGSRRGRSRPGSRRSFSGCAANRVCTSGGSS